MKKKYQKWIENYKASNAFIRGMCFPATKEMVVEFPELEQVAGHIDLALGGKIEHWWCIDSKGKVIDPTESQFFGPKKYIQFKPGTSVKIGKCMNCGDHIYERLNSLQDKATKSSSFCSNDCEMSLLADFNSGI